ncbi:MAG: glycine cleavage system protein GcvH [Candidatus Altiarchaeota archaeon]|nr:glycine cleavage system protein GcvH [Candidatus Altiarchaeota archaeon]
MDFPKDLKYTREHEWVKIDGDVATVGITDYAQNALGDIVFIELPKKGASVEKSKGAAVVESVKSVSDVYSPMSGTVVEVNEALNSSPDAVNKKPYTEGWMFKMKVKNVKDAEGLMNASEYEKYVAQQKH